MEGFLLVMIAFIPVVAFFVLGAAFLVGVLKESAEMKAAPPK